MIKVAWATTSWRSCETVRLWRSLIDAARSGGGRMILVRVNDHPCTRLFLRFSSRRHSLGIGGEESAFHHLLAWIRQRAPRSSFPEDLDLEHWAKARPTSPRATTRDF
jgi:hypothetical protein